MLVIQYNSNLFHCKNIARLMLKSATATQKYFPNYVHFIYYLGVYLVQQT